MALKNLTLDRLLLWTGCGVLAVFFLPVTLGLLWQIPRDREKSLIERSLLSSNDLAERVVDPLLTGDTFKAANLLRDALESSPSFRYALLLNDRGEVVAHTFEEGPPEELYRLLVSGRKRTVLFRSSRGPLLDVASPIIKGQLGFVHLGVSRAEVIQTQKRIVLTALGILAAALAVLLAGISRVSLLVSRPLSELDRKAREYLPDDLKAYPQDDPQGTVEVRNIASRFLYLLDQIRAVEKELPAGRQEVSRTGKAGSLSRILSPRWEVPKEETGDIWSEAYLQDRYSWLVFHRWVAVCGVVIVWLAYYLLSRKPISPLPTFFCIAGLALWNTFLQFRAKRSTASMRGRRPLRFWLMAQIISDLIALTFLLHFYGGMENPFKLFYVFLMVIAGLTFPFRASRWLALIGSSLYGGMVVCEMASFLPHYSLFPGTASVPSGIWAMPYLVMGEILGMTIVQFGVVFFVHTISLRRREAESARKAAETIAFSRERMAMLGELAAGVAHEVRNPIHGLLNALDLLKEKVKSSEDTNELLSLLGEGLRRISTISDRLLRLGHSGTMIRGPVDLEHAVCSTVDLVRETARKKNVSIKIHTEGEIPYFEGDADKISEAILNLLTNSLDASAQGGSITVRLAAETGPLDTLRLVVSDTGSGIPPEVMARIFDPFFTTKAVGQGSGLGLALVRETVHLHGGTVEVESTPGKGTTVTITIPLGNRNRESRQEELDKKN